MTKFLRRLRKDETGAAMVEYTVLLGLITAAVIAIVTLLGANITRIFTAVNTLFNGIG